MTYQRRAYDDLDTTSQMHLDCDACGSWLPLAAPVDVAAALAEPPSIEFSRYPQDLPKPQITVSEAAALLASRLHLHLD